MKKYKILKVKNKIIPEVIYSSAYEIYKKHFESSGCMICNLENPNLIDESKYLNREHHYLDPFNISKNERIIFGYYPKNYLPQIFQESKKGSQVILENVILQIEKNPSFDYRDDYQWKNPIEIIYFTSKDAEEILKEFFDKGFISKKYLGKLYHREHEIDESLII